MMRFQEQNGCSNSNLQFRVEDLVLGLEECEILTCSQQQPQVPNAHKKKSTVRLTPESQCSESPIGPFFTDSWSQLRSSARHTLSNQQAQVKQPETY